MTVGCRSSEGKIKRGRELVRARERREKRPIDTMFEGGAMGFIFKGTNGRWRDVLTDDEVACYQKRASECLSVEAVEWLEHGRNPG